MTIQYRTRLIDLVADHLYRVVNIYTYLQPFLCSPDMGSSLAVKVRYGLGSGNH